MTAIDALAELGLTEEDAVLPVVPVADVVAEAAAAVTDGATPKAERAPIVIKSISVGVGALPASRKPAKGERVARGPRESKYKFGELVAPVLNEDGSYGYSNFAVEPEEGTTIVALRRALQSATTAENKKGAEAGIKFITRAIYNEADEAVAVAVYRVDGTLATEAE